MKKYSLKVAIYCLFLLVILTSPSITFAQDNTHIKYFGYYWGMSGINKVSSYVTAMFVSNQWTTSDIGELANKDIQNLNTLNSFGIKGVVDVSSVFFNLQNKTFRPDWESRWNTYWTMIYPHLSKIAAFYPMDEPEGNVSMTDYAKAVHIIKINVDTVDYPIAILMVVTPSGAIRIGNGTLAVPPDVSWLGFDEYGCWDSGCYQGISIPDKFQFIVTNAKQTPGRKVVVVPGAVAHGQTVPSPEAQQQMVVFINNYYQLCKNEPLCIGMFPFLWLTMPNTQGGLIGADTMTIVDARLKQIGLEMKPSITGDLNGDGKVDIFDYNILVSDFGKTGSPGWIKSDITKDGKVDIFDYNVLMGNFGT